MSEPSSARLRAATAVLHRRVEDGVDLLHRVETREGAASLLLRMEAFYRTLEPLLERSLAGRVAPEFLAPRAPRLRDDLDRLAPGWQALPAPEMPPLADPLGALYVIEGAALGGQVIARHLVARLGFRSAFFGGEGVGPRWRAFRAILDGWGEYEAVEAGAIATFRAFERAVVEEAVLA